MTQKVIVVGAVAGGATAASQLRRLDSSISITVYEKDRDMSFANCGLPYYLGHVVTSRDDMVPITPTDFKEKKNIDVYLKHEVISVNSEDNSVQIKNHQTGEIFTDYYDTLILSPGARAHQLDFDSPHLFTLRNMEDTDAIENYITENNVDRVLIVGGGYVSLEVLENMYERGLKPTLIHRSEAINKHMDQDMNQIIFDALDERHIPYRLNEEIKAIDGRTVTFTSGQQEKYDLIITGVGVKPNSDFLKDSGIQLDEKGYIPVNACFQTNVPNVYALGDIATNRYRHVDLPAHIPLAWGAHRGASIIAEQLAGDANITFKGFIGANIVKFFDYTLTSTGIAPHELKYFDHDVVDVHQTAHAGYYPNNATLHLRAYYEKTSRKLLRAVAVGQQGADKRIDILTMAMMHGATIDELTEFEIAYAPPYSHPKDAINMLGYKARL